MASSPPTVFLVGCDPVVEVQVIEDNGNLVILANSIDGRADIDGLFFNLTNEAVAPGLTIFPEVDTGQVVDFTVAPNTLNQLNNGAQLQDQFDVRVELGVEPFTTEGTVNSGGFSLYLNAGVPLTADDIAIENFTVVVNSDGGEGGIALSNAGGTPTQDVVVTAFTENFNGLHTPEQSDSVVGDTHWDIIRNKLHTDGNNDGRITFEAAETDGPVSFSFDARAAHTARFEASGRAADTFEVQVNIDGQWITLDTFVVNANKTALVGSETGQTLTHGWSNLSYEGGILDDAQGDVQFRFVSDISANDENIFIDNVEMSVTEGGSGGTEQVCLDFDDAAAGDVVSDQFDGVTITAQRDGDRADSENDAMIFDTNNPTGRDHDLAYDGVGNVIIISEDNDSDDPDDEAHGGTISFEFEALSTVDSINVLDIEERGGTIDLFDSAGELISSVDIPVVGDNGQGTVQIGVSNVASMDVNLAGSGAVDDLCFETTTPADDPTEDDCFQYDVTYDDEEKGPEEVMIDIM